MPHLKRFIHYKQDFRKLLIKKYLPVLTRISHLVLNFGLLSQRVCLLNYCLKEFVLFHLVYF